MKANAGAAVATVLLLAACSDGVGHGWDWNRMRVQPKAVSYGPAGALPGGSAMQIPPAGTFPADSDESPPSHDTGRGEQRFRVFCAICHGAAADGRSLIASNMSPPKPPSLLRGAAATLNDAALDSTMVFGRGTMMGFGADIPAADRRAIASYIRQLQRAAGVTP